MVTMENRDNSQWLVWDEDHLMYEIYDNGAANHLEVTLYKNCEAAVISVNTDKPTSVTEVCLEHKEGKDYEVVIINTPWDNVVVEYCDTIILKGKED